MLSIRTRGRLLMHKITGWQHDDVIGYGGNIFSRCGDRRVDGPRC